MVRQSLQAPFSAGGGAASWCVLPIFMQEEVVCIDPRMPRNEAKHFVSGAGPARRACSGSFMASPVMVDQDGE
jgi:hypothetical protein